MAFRRCHVVGSLFINEATLFANSYAASLHYQGIDAHTIPLDVFQLNKSIFLLCYDGCTKYIHIHIQMCYNDFMCKDGTVCTENVSYIMLTTYMDFVVYF